MSLDVYLTFESSAPGQEERHAIFVRENGQTCEITREEWDARYPDREPVTAQVGGTHEVFSSNITHNLNTMAEAAGIYKALWRPEEIGISKAAQLVQPLKDGLATLQSNPGKFHQYNPPNGWGSYDVLCRFVAEYLAACMRYPEANVSVWR